MQVKCSEYVKELLAGEDLALFDEFVCEHIFDLVLVNTSPLYIGSGRAEALGAPIDLTVIRSKTAEVVDGNVKVYEGPIIPGSTLKGVFRSLAESIAISLGKLAESITFDDEELSCTGDKLDKVEELLSQQSCNDELKQAIQKYKDVCFASPVVLLFGAPWIQSKLSFYDAYPLNMETPETDTVTRVSIDRITGSQRPRQLYSMEFVKAGVKWRARIRLFNLDPFSEDDAAKILRLLLKMAATEGIRVGGRTSIGHGVLRLLVDESKVISIKLDREKAVFVREETPLQKLLEK
jgi:CRISPR-associated protein Csm3